MTNNPLVEALREARAVLKDPCVGTIHHDDPDWYASLDAAVTKIDAALVSSAPATGELERELERGLTRIARSNLRHYLNAAQFKCEADRTAALNCLDVLEKEIDGLSDLVAVLRSYHAAEDRLAALSSAPATGEREQIVGWLRANKWHHPLTDEAMGDAADAIARGDHRTQSGEMEGGEHG